MESTWSICALITWPFFFTLSLYGKFEFLIFARKVAISLIILDHVLS